MSDSDTAKELEKLRADVTALSDAHREATSAPAEPATVSPPAADEDLPDATRTQMEELGDLLQAEIRDLPTITCLTVFSLGILMGRLMR